MELSELSSCLTDEVSDILSNISENLSRDKDYLSMADGCPLFVLSDVPFARGYKILGLYLQVLVQKYPPRISSGVLLISR